MKPPSISAAAAKWMKENQALTNRNDASTIEWLAWQDICERLHRLGVVSNEELSMPVSMKGTPGLDLIHAIKKWGKAYVKLVDYQSLMGVKEKDRG